MFFLRCPWNRIRKLSLYKYTAINLLRLSHECRSCTLSLFPLAWKICTEDDRQYFALQVQESYSHFNRRNCELPKLCKPTAPGKQRWICHQRDNKWLIKSLISESKPPRMRVVYINNKINKYHFQTPWGDFQLISSLSLAQKESAATGQRLLYCTLKSVWTENLDSRPVWPIDPQIAQRF